MTKNLFNFLLDEFTRQYLDVLIQRSGTGDRTYGFEYEFLPRDSLSFQDLQNLFQLLSSIGMTKNGYEFESDGNIRISFEPGGQIEYQSPPLRKQDGQQLASVIEFINSTNALIKKNLNIEYIGTGFFPGRRDALLCLQSPRYIKLHERLKRTGSRGLEMMKATASIHLHVVISRLEDLLPMFCGLCELSDHPEFKMSFNRRNIWDNTDPCRCGLPPCCFADLGSADELIERLVHFALHAEVLGEDVAFASSKDQSFEAFLYHMTTLFTDVRFNLKGPTLELRTLDSMPTDRFLPKWNLFISLIEPLISD